MARRKLTAAEYIERYDGEMRVILGELAENAARANNHWTMAVDVVRRNPERALEELSEAWVALATSIKVERSDALKLIDRASALLDRELPDEDESQPTG